MLLRHVYYNIVVLCTRELCGRSDGVPAAGFENDLSVRSEEYLYLTYTLRVIVLLYFYIYYTRPYDIKRALYGKRVSRHN